MTSTKMKLNKAEKAKLDKGLCIAEGCTNQLEPPEYSWMPQTRRTCSGKCRSKRYRDRKRCGLSTTPLQRKQDKTRKKMAELLERRRQIAGLIEHYMAEAYEIDRSITKKAKAAQLDVPDLPIHHRHVPVKPNREQSTTVQGGLFAMAPGL